MPGFLQSNKAEYLALLTSNLTINLHSFSNSVPAALLPNTPQTDNSKKLPYTHSRHRHLQHTSLSSLLRPIFPTPFPSPHSTDRHFQHISLPLNAQTDKFNTLPFTPILRPTPPTHFPFPQYSDRKNQHNSRPSILRPTHPTPFPKSP